MMKFHVRLSIGSWLMVLIVGPSLALALHVAPRQTHRTMSMVWSSPPLVSTNDVCVSEAEATQHGSEANPDTITSLVSTPLVKVGWMERFRQLQEFKDEYGHTLVPKRYKENQSLGNWVNKQRQQYRNYLSGTKPCSLTQSRIELLNHVGFCWDATTATVDKAKTLVSPEKEEQWWQHLDELQVVHGEHNGASQKGCLVQVPRATRLGTWLDRQRKAYHDAKLAPSLRDPTRRDSESVLSHEQVSALSSLDPFWWMTRRQWQWECRFCELHDYVGRHGDCCVPISYHNKLLAHWVSNQRKQYNRRMNGESSDLTNDRLRRLEAIGFVWNRWEYEFDKKENAWSS